MRERHGERDNSAAGDVACCSVDRYTVVSRPLTWQPCQDGVDTWPLTSGRMHAIQTTTQYMDYLITCRERVFCFILMSSGDFI